MSRIGAIGQNKENLQHLQKLVVNAMEWGINELVNRQKNHYIEFTRIVTVGSGSIRQKTHLFDPVRDYVSTTDISTSNILDYPSSAGM